MSEAAIENLRTCQEQLDQDGIMVGVSRQAVEETLDHVAQLQQRNAELAGALQAVHDDLLIRAEFGSNSEKVVSVGFSVWEKVKKALFPTNTTTGAMVPGSRKP